MVTSSLSHCFRRRERRAFTIYGKVCPGVREIKVGGTRKSKGFRVEKPGEKKERAAIATVTSINQVSFSYRTRSREALQSREEHPHR